MSPPSWVYHIAGAYSRLDAVTVTPEKALELARPISAVEAEKIDWQDWKQRAHPWPNSSFFHAQREEIRLFRAQACFTVDPERRRKEFEERVRQENIAFRERIRNEALAFELEENERYADKFYPFTHRLWYRGVEETRRKAVPAYNFELFGQLPAELQLRIWSFAARFEDPRTNRVIPMCCDTSHRCAHPYLSRSDYLSCNLDRSSRIEHLKFTHEEVVTTPDPVPALLHVCQVARKEARKVYTLMNSRSRFGGQKYCGIYFNTLYDSFQICGRSWSDVKVLVDFAIKINCDRPLRSDVQRDLNGLLEIRNLVVDFNIFAEVPVQVWVEFQKLERLTISFTPWNFISDNSHDWMEDDYARYLEAPKPDTILDKHAQWIVDAATKSFQKVKIDKTTTWKPPQLSAMVCREKVDPDDSEDEVDPDPEDDSDYDDDNWYEEAKEKMEKMQSTVGNIRNLISKFNPRQRHKKSFEGPRRQSKRLSGKRT